ncbi:Aste57867_17557 [Aphanomyces stellatus]|uniref:Aste57867_17557 protein n=1 Tax=Aphanomyces stellatus TaxID=120398 RepID=A0A485L897_9STRA|nr:hypothetical protein As57867_017497 [Aphanomyces stellatus]VFT94309.1 Aste57867_17557 [Aphanomyces stellatus]
MLESTKRPSTPAVVAKSSVRCMRFLSVAAAGDQDVVEWTEAPPSTLIHDDFCFLAQNAKNITVRAAGVYQVDVSGVCSDVQCTVLLLVNGVRVASTVGDMAGYFVQMTKKVQLPAKSLLKFCVSTPDCAHHECRQTQCGHVLLASEAEVWVTLIMPLEGVAL